MWKEFLVLWQLLPFVIGSQQEQALRNKLFNSSNYSLMVRPRNVNQTEPLVLYVDLKLRSIVELDEKNEVLKLHVSMVQEWQDLRLQWEPDEYGGLEMMVVKAAEIWLPDLVLDNDVTGRYVVGAGRGQVRVDHTGTVLWKTPLQLSTICQINVYHWPYDQQHCRLSFQLWTEDGSTINLLLYPQKRQDGQYHLGEGVALNLYDFYRNTEWDLIDARAFRQTFYHPCCIAPYYSLSYQLTLNRKHLYYTVNVVAPALCIYVITLMSFILPAGSGEKMTLSLTTMLSLLIFGVVNFGILPEQSLRVPLMLRFILFTFIAACAAVVIHIIGLNVRHRSVHMGEVPRIARWLFLEILAKIFCLKRSVHGEEEPVFQQDPSDVTTGESAQPEPESPETAFQQDQSEPQPGCSTDVEEESKPCAACAGFAEGVRSALADIRQVASNIQQKQQRKQKETEWLLMADVLDKLGMWIYGLVTAVGTLTLFLSTPSVWDNQKPLSYL